MLKIPVMIVDDFFDNPDQIRDYALSLDFKKTSGSYPGLRTELIDTLNFDLFNTLGRKIFSLLYDFNVHNAGGHLQACFQVIDKNCEEGWVHSDLSTDDWSVAGVIYLTPNAPLTSGTSIYRLKSGLTEPKQNSLKDEFYSGNSIDINQYRVQRDSFNNQYEKTLEVSNIYNRLVMYNTKQFHRGDVFFGNDILSSRLTLVFFAKILGNVPTPTERCEQVMILGV